MNTHAVRQRRVVTWMCSSGRSTMAAHTRSSTPPGQLSNLLDWLEPPHHHPNVTRNFPFTSLSSISLLITWSASHKQWRMTIPLSSYGFTGAVKKWPNFNLEPSLSESFSRDRPRRECLGQRRSERERPSSRQKGRPRTRETRVAHSERSIAGLSVETSRREGRC